MTARTMTSKNSRRRDMSGEGSRGAALASCGCGAAMNLGEELSADPLQLFAGRIAQLDLAAVQRAGELDRQSQGGLDVRCQGPNIRGRVTARAASWPVRANPVFGLAYRQMPRHDHLEAVLLRGLRLQRDQGARVARGDDAGGD